MKALHNIVWMRSDLRTTDNPALADALISSPQYLVRVVFVITEQQWRSHGWGDNKIGFVLNSVLALEPELAKLNIQLDILTCADFQQTIIALGDYLIAHKAASLYYNEEYELNENIRDVSIEQFCKKKSIAVHKFGTQTLIPPGKILTKQNTPYTVFTPFKKRCYEYLHRTLTFQQNKPKAQNPTNDLYSTSKQIEIKYKEYLHSPIQKLWPAGQVEAAKILQQFCDNAIDKYQSARDYPAQAGTSQLAPHLAVGSISARQCLLAALNANQQQLEDGNPNITCWISELLWRDFYKQIVFHFPDICKGKNFNTKYENMRWQRPGVNLELWQNGKTGIPIIDAAMRQLVATGWMHNRLRMIVAMFLTKNLLIDWRHGESFFGQHLVDLDFASNNGGWQWSASTGTDSVPYFRIFNPVTQSSKFDKDGVFIKSFCPELASLSPKQIHDPSAALSSAQLEKIKYPSIMVDLSKSRLRALEYFKSV